jgi:DNA-binding CsgD family transcriptional regulator
VAITIGSGTGPWPGGAAGEQVLRGRRAERAALDELLAATKAGRSQVLVVVGEAGVGKTALLDYLQRRASGCQVVRAAAIESEMELAFAGLHQLCAPMLGRLSHIPAPQRTALGTAFGLSSGVPPDRFLVALAVLSLLTEASEEDPLVCVVDDAHWLDSVSAQTLAFVARRLLAERVALVFAVRPEIDHEFDGLRTLVVHGLDKIDARELLDSVLTAPLDQQVRARMVAETRGNPLALLELARDPTPTKLKGGFGLPETMPLARRIEEEFLGRLSSLPSSARTLLLTAAAEPTGDAILLWRALERLEIPRQAASDPRVARLLDVGAQVRFSHPLARSAVYRSASASERAKVHQALADATDPEVDPDRRAWHRAAAASEPDEDIAKELERSASRAQARGGLAAAAAFLQRAVALTGDPARRAERALAAALANLQAGAFDVALELLVDAEAASLDKFQRARVGVLRGQIAFASNIGSGGPPLLLEAAKRLEQLDAGLARDTYLDAWGAALFAGRSASAGNLLEVSQAARAAPAPANERASDLLLNGLATLITEGRDVAAPLLRQATAAFVSEQVSAEEGFRWGWLATLPAEVLWDDESWHAINVRQVERAREVGALARLPIALTALAILESWWGNFASAAAAIEEADAVAEATKTRIAPFAALMLASCRGGDEASSLIDSTIEALTAADQGGAVQYAQWVASILYNGLGRYEQALGMARQACDDEFDLFLSAWALPELIEASVKTGDSELAHAALERLSRAAATADNDWALGTEARSRALLSEGELAQAGYREAIDRLGRTRFRTELARAQLLFGEWLGRENRRAEAREQLRAAHRMFMTIGMDAFAERARNELLATGERVSERPPDGHQQLTSQELQIARLARDGLSNPEIGAQLFLSHRTVEWHLHKVFAKLGVKSRSALRQALLADDVTLPAPVTP